MAVQVLVVSGPQVCCYSVILADFHPACRRRPRSHTARRRRLYVCTLQLSARIIGIAFRNTALHVSSELFSFSRRVLMY